MRILPHFWCCCYTHSSIPINNKNLVVTMDPIPATEIPVTVGAAMGDKTSGLSWLSNTGIVKLNLMLILFQISSYATGYDGSMMNGLQSLDTWKEFFNYPDASELGL